MLLAQVFACTVGQKPSRAPFYVNDTVSIPFGSFQMATLPDGGPETSFGWPPVLVIAFAVFAASIHDLQSVVSVHRILCLFGFVACAQLPVPSLHRR